MSSESFNSDPHEINKFNEMADDWWNPDGNLKTLHWINPLRLSYIQSQTTIINQRILDVGCGGGLLSEALVLKGGDVTGIDLSDLAIRAAKAHAATKGLVIDYRCEALESLVSAKPELFDVITCMELLEHVPDPQQLIAQCASLLRPGGTLFLATVNRNLKAYFAAIIAAEYVLRWLPKGTHQYGKFIRPSELRRWASNVSLRHSHVQGLHYSPVTGEFSLSQDVSINYMMTFRKNAGAH